MEATPTVKSDPPPVGLAEQICDSAEREIMEQYKDHTALDYVRAQLGTDAGSNGAVHREGFMGMRG